MDKQTIETIYGLAPLQQAFLWHSLQTSVSAGLIHMRCTLRGHVDVELLQRAWHTVVSCHPVLRTSVHWQGIKQPVQVVAKQVTIPWTHLDGRGIADPQAALTDFLGEDRQLGFDLTQAPLTRLALLRWEDACHELVWSCHHLMLDGWSGALVFNQVFDCYGALRQGKAWGAAPGPTYQSYVRWLKQQDEGAAAAFWREELTGMGAMRDPGLLTSLRLGAVEAQTSSPLEHRGDTNPSITLTPEVTAGVQDFLRSQRLTLNTLMQGIWALLLHSYSGQSDILFGATVSGRQGDLPGVDSIVGLLINVLPVRVRMAPEQAVIDWLKALQTQQAMASRYAHASLDQIQAWSQISGRLFDSLLVIENYPMQAQTEQSLRVENIQSGLVSTYGLTVIVKPGDVLAIMLRAEHSQDHDLTGLLERFRMILLAISNHSDQALNDLLPVEIQPVMAVPETVETVVPNLSRDQLEGTFFAPHNPLELKLTQIWESVLGVSGLSVEDSFFEVGGNSLLAVQLFNQMQQQLDCGLPLATLFQAPNIRKFATLLSQEHPVAPWSSLVPIQTSGTRLPLFFHGGSADALTWAQFSHRLGTDRPFYALQRPDLDGSDVTHHTVEALATDCVKEMRMVQPQGPYLVGGHCLGGAVAVEIAQQLQADGEDVAQVILIDSYRPGPLSDQAWITIQNRLQLSVFWLRKNYYYHGSWENLMLLPRKVWQKIVTIPNRSIPYSTPISIEKTPDNVPYDYRYTRAQKANELAAERYRPRPYAGSVKLFRAKIQILDWHFGRDLGWQTVAKGGVALTQIPGFFGNLFNQRSAPLLAAAVRDYLAELE